MPVRKMKDRDIEWTTGCLSSSLTIHYDLGFVAPITQFSGSPIESASVDQYPIKAPHKKREEGRKGGAGWDGEREMKVSVKLDATATFS